MTIEYLKSWLKLAFAPGNRVHFIRALENAQLPLADVLQLSERELQGFSLKPNTLTALKQPNHRKIDQHLDWAESDNHHIIPYDHPDYPPILKEITDPPLLLYIAGDPKLLSKPQLAMVGSRRPTPMGLETAHQFASEFSRAGLIITSGLAIGIDGASHRGALAANNPTIAVQACGLDIIYPWSHRQLAHEIFEQGAIVSEKPLGTEPQRTFFPARNRIVSGLSLGTLVVEAAKRSGSLITAYQALEQGRFVGAIPGSIHNPTSQGCHQLLVQGATLISTPAEVLAELNMKMPEKTNEIANMAVGGLDITQQKLLECVAFEATPLDRIYTRSEMETSHACYQLLQLELKGLIQAIPGGYARVKI